VGALLERTRRIGAVRTKNVQAVFFYLFATIMIASAGVVIFARNPVHSVLFLILAFCNGAGLFLLAGAEFLAMILIVVYVGAVAVLFLFVVMMLDVDFAELKQGFLSYMPVGVLVAAALLFELGLVASASMSADGAPSRSRSPPPRPSPMPKRSVTCSIPTICSCFRWRG